MKDTGSEASFDNKLNVLATETYQLPENIKDSFSDKKQIGLASDITKFLLRIDLDFSRMTQFVDKAVCYIT